MMNNWPIPLLVAALFLLAYVLHTAVHLSLFSLVPMIFLVPVVLAWNTTSALPYVLLWGMVAELFSTSPGGIVLLVTLLPVGMARLTKNIPVDVSGRFFVVLLVTIALQTAVATSDSWIHNPWRSLPLPLVAIVIVFSALFCFLFSLLWLAARPYDG